MALQSQVIWQGALGTQRCPEGWPISASSPSSPIQTNVRSDPNETEASSCLSDGSFTQSPDAQTPHKLRGSLDTPVKRDHVHCAIKIQTEHWIKPGLSHPGSHAMSLLAALCTLTCENLLSYIFSDIYVHLYEYIYNLIILTLRAQCILPGYKCVYIGPPEHFTSRQGWAGDVNQPSWVIIGQCFCSSGTTSISIIGGRKSERVFYFTHYCKP